MKAVDLIGSIRRSFDDDLSVALYKHALIERYCLEEISARDVQDIFAATPALKSA